MENDEKLQYKEEISFSHKFEKSFKNTALGDNCFLKGCKWSPDGFCLLAASEDFCLRLFDFPIDSPSAEDFNPILKYSEGGTIYDFAWYPLMNSCDETSCVFASTSRDSPIHLWDAYDGSLRATYQPINQYDEVHSAYSLCFSPDGKIIAGFKKEIKIFDLTLPGREFEKRSLKDGYQNGIISTIDVNPSLSKVYALGSYDKTIGLYTEPDGELLCLFQAHKGGVTRVQFSSDGTRLYSGGRQDDELFCWDLRNPGSILFTVKRAVNTCQRIYFDLSPCSKYLFTGSTDGTVDVYDVDRMEPVADYLPKKFCWRAHSDATNGVSVHPQGNVLATSSGQRHALNHLSDDEEDSSNDEVIENTVKVWKLT